MKDRQMPFRWPWLEILAGLCAAMLAWRFPDGTAFLHWFLLLIFMLAITGTDMLAKLIPPEVTWLGTLVGVGLSMLWPDGVLTFLQQGDLLWRFGLPTHPPEIAGLFMSLGGAIAGGLLMELIRRVFSHMVHMQVMGFGDTLIMIMMGAFLGPKLVIFSLFPACLIGVLIGAVHRVIAGVPHSPFGPALAAGGLLTLLSHDWMVKGLGGYQSLLQRLSGSGLVVFSLVLLVIAFMLIWRIRQKRVEYERQIEDDYQSIEEKIQR